MRSRRGAAIPASMATPPRVRVARRFGQLLILLLLALPAFPGRVEAAPGAAADKIRAFYATLLSVMKDGPRLGPQGRFDRLKPVIGETFDLSYMARAVVGPAWSSAPENKRQEMTDAFWRYVTATYASRFDSYEGQQLEAGGEQPYGANTIVDTRIVRVSGKTVVIKYLMRPDGQNWRIADIYLDGTVSELATRRSEFSSIVREQGIAGLIVRLNQKAEGLVRADAQPP